MASEFPSFDLNAALMLGMVPLIRSAADPESTLAGYASLYLHQEVQAEGLVRNIGNFSRFLETVSFSHGSILNVSNVARDAEVSRKTAEGYIGVLEDLLLSFRLEPFTRRAKRDIISHPKFYLFDAGVFRSLRPRGPLDPAAEIDGPALEGLVAQHLRAWIAYSQNDAKLSYWRTRGGLEVDFVLYGSDTFSAIEVKNSAHVHNIDLRPMRAFLDDYPEATGIMLYRGRDRREVSGVKCIPVDQWLSELRPNRGVLW
jgi:predicted AAA+ superfamily ATPase